MQLSVCKYPVVFNPCGHLFECAGWLGDGVLRNGCLKAHTGPCATISCCAGSFCDWILVPELPQMLIVEDARKDPRQARVDINTSTACGSACVRACVSLCLV